MNRALAVATHAFLAEVLEEVLEDFEGLAALDEEEDDPALTDLAGESFLAAAEDFWAFAAGLAEFPRFIAAAMKAANNGCA